MCPCLCLFLRLTLSVVYLSLYFSFISLCLCLSLSSLSLLPLSISLSVCLCLSPCLVSLYFSLSVFSVSSCVCLSYSSCLVILCLHLFLCSSVFFVARLPVFPISIPFPFRCPPPTVFPVSTRVFYRFSLCVRPTPYVGLGLCLTLLRRLHAPRQGSHTSTTKPRVPPFPLCTQTAVAASFTGTAGARRELYHLRPGAATGGYTSQHQDLRHRAGVEGSAGGCAGASRGWNR